MLFKIHFSIKRDNTIEDGTRIISAESAAEATAAFKTDQYKPQGATLIIRKVKVHRA